MTTSNPSATPFDLDQDERNSMEEILKQADEPGSFSKGEVIQATVIQSDEQLVYLDIGKKQEGQADRAEFPEAPAPGTDIQVVVIHTSPDGPVRLSKKEADRRVSWENIREAHENGVQLRGKVLKAVNHGYLVEVDGLELFLPMSHSSDRPGRKTARLAMGKELDFKILELKDRHRSAVISHRAVIEERNDASWNELMEKHNEGDVLEGTVSKIVSFGVFVNIAVEAGNIEGLLHQSDISWRKFPRFKGMFKKGESIQVKLLTMDRENNRLSLGLKQLTEDPLEWARRELQVGDTVTGKVTSITDYGAFIEIREGLEGLIHVSELTWAKRVKHPRNYLEKDQEVQAQVLDFDFESKRISLGLRQLQEDPWDSLAGSIKAGDEREGEVTSITKFGAFVEVLPDIEGLVHFNDYAWDDKIDKKMLKKGDKVSYKVLEINMSERRLSLGIKQLTASPYEVIRQKYKNGQVLECEIKSITSFGMFLEVEPGYEGLVHISNIPLKGGETLESRYKVGDTVKAALQKIDVNAQKIALSIKAFEKKEEKAIIDQYLKKDDSPSTSSPFGSFFKQDVS